MRQLWAAAILAGAGVIGAAPAQAHVVSGPARAVDGDTLDFTGYRVRLLGMDAPEARQSCQRNGAEWACGQEASARLAQLVEGQSVRCEGAEQDVYGRLVAVCVANGLDLGRAMVESGLAVVLPNGEDRYGPSEQRLKALRFGLWGAQFQQPADWRRANHADPAPPRAPAPDRPSAQISAHISAQPASRPARAKVYRNALGCAIKGNHSWRGEWIYHLPGTLHYAETRPEALFCTEEQAFAAGYRRARND